jgi:hypothetical protein
VWGRFTSPFVALEPGNLANSVALEPVALVLLAPFISAISAAAAAAAAAAAYPRCVWRGAHVLVYGGWLAFRNGGCVVHTLLKTCCWSDVTKSKIKTRRTS